MLWDKQVDNLRTNHRVRFIRFVHDVIQTDTLIFYNIGDLCSSGQPIQAHRETFILGG